MSALSRLQAAPEAGLTLVRYQAMCTAIAECHRVDEATDIRDKARALEVYYQQANNTEAERKAIDIRLRAERRAGELLKELARAEGPQQGKAGPGRGNTSDAATCFEPRGTPKSEPPPAAPHNQHRSTVQPQPAPTPVQPPKSEYARTLDDLGMSRQKAHRFQQLAAVPKETFEAALADPVKQPTAAAIVRQIVDPVKPIDSGALRIWGKARDFERHRDADCDPAKMLHEMTETMRRDMARLVPAVLDYWQRFDEAIRNEHS